MHVVVTELNRSSSKLLFIVIQLKNKILGDTDGSLGNLLVYKVHNWALETTIPDDLNA